MNNKKQKTRKDIKKGDKNLRIFLLLSLILIVLFFVVINLSTYTYEDIVKMQERRVQATPASPPPTDPKALSPQEQIRFFADDCGILPRLLRFNTSGTTTVVNLPVNYATTDLNYTNFKLTQFLTAHKWHQISGIEETNPQRQVLTFTTPDAEHTYRFRISYAQEGVYPKVKPQMAIIVKGFGNLTTSELTRWLSLDKNICYSVLPIQNNISRMNIQTIVDNGFEALVEIPMEAPGFPVVNTPEYAIFAHFKDSEVTAKLNQYFRLLPKASGTITHLGGLITTDHRIMPLILQQIKNRRLYFIDDKAIETSIALELAQKMMIPSAEKTVTFNPARYKDDENNRRLTEALKTHQNDPVIVTLTSPDDDTYQFVIKLFDVAQKEGYEVVKVSELKIIKIWE